MGWAGGGAVLKGFLLWWSASNVHRYVLLTENGNVHRDNPKRGPNIIDSTETIWLRNFLQSFFIMINYGEALPRKLARVVDVVIHIASLVDISQRAGWTGTAGPAHYFQHPIQDQQSLFHQFCCYQYFQNFLWSCDHNSENTQRTRWATTVRPAHCFQHHKNNIFRPFTIF